MKNFSLLALICAVSASPLSAGQGDNIRGSAPMTALVLDAREGNSGPLKDAYLDHEIDFFLDFERPQNKIISDLLNLREAGRNIEAGDFSTAEQRIRAIQGYSDQKIYLRAVLDAAQGRYQQSLEGFRQLIDRRFDVPSRHLVNLAFMGAARVFHEIQDYKQAIYHYNQVHQLQSEFFQSVFEKSWSFYLNGDMNGALGASLTFLSPYFESAFYPESMLVRAASFFQMCYFDRASATVDQTKKHYEPIQKQVRELIRRDPRNWIFEERILKTVHKSILGFMVADTRYRSLLRAYQGLVQEQKTLGRRKESAVNAQALNFVKGRMVAEATRVLQTADKQISDILSQMEIIDIEILQAAANQILGRTPDEQIKLKIIDLGDVDFDAKVQFWPFKGEFWVDELGSYYYGLKSNCENPELSKNRVNSKLYAVAARHKLTQKVW